MCFQWLIGYCRFLQVSAPSMGQNLHRRKCVFSRHPEPFFMQGGVFALFAPYPAVDIYKERLQEIQKRLFTIYNYIYMYECNMQSPVNQPNDFCFVKTRAQNGAKSAKTPFLPANRLQTPLFSSLFGGEVSAPSPCKNLQKPAITPSASFSLYTKRRAAACAPVR